MGETTLKFYNVMAEPVQHLDVESRPKRESIDEDRNSTNEILKTCLCTLHFILNEPYISYLEEKLKN